MNRKLLGSGLSFYCRVSVTENQCPHGIEIDVSGGVEWQHPQLQTAKKVLNRFTRSRFGIGADGGGALCLDLINGEITFSASLNWYAYANFGWERLNRTYNYGGGWETPPIKIRSRPLSNLLPDYMDDSKCGCACVRK